MKKNLLDFGFLLICIFQEDKSQSISMGYLYPAQCAGNRIKVLFSTSAIRLYLKIVD
ncbi:hypothetical protein [Emticicia fluvialis]|uniref:hypothetical protein n=1 Tax=Emticicia fluvialis TaxID=2974474 RepID=UPI00216538D2|nr:hypothetical protein [Emticicia fluvialis]